MKVLIGVILLAIGTGVYLCKKEVGEDEIFFLQNNYQGAVYVIYKQKSGKPVKYEKGKRVYEISEEGILRTQFDFNDAWHNIPRYYYNDRGKLIELPYKLEGKDVKGETVQVCCISSGSAYKAINGQPIPYQVFYVGSERAIDSAFAKQDKMDITKYLE